MAPQEVAMQSHALARPAGLLLVLTFVASVSALASASALAADRPFEKGPPVGDLRKVGTVHLTTSCSPDVQKDFAVGTALLHSFFYSEARRVFIDVAAQDPTCAMAQWGIAMTWWHPIWAAPSAEDLAQGRQAIERAHAIGGKTDLERGYITALSAFYAEPMQTADVEGGQSCHGPTGGGMHMARALAYEKAMEELFTRHPQDVEVAAFYSLALRRFRSRVAPRRSWSPSSRRIRIIPASSTT
jgi:hypothetical protein